MTLFEIFLSFFGIFLIFFSLFWLQKISFVLRFLILFSGISLIIFTIFPHFLGIVGEIFGLERGADLLVYISISFLFFMVLLLLRRQNTISEKITKMIREMAINAINNEEWKIKNFPNNSLLKEGEIFSFNNEMKMTETKQKKSKNSYKIAIVMPIFNEWNILQKTFETLQNFQKKYKNFCIIAVNDGSHDDSLEILKNVQKNFRELLVVSHSQNLGQGAALETGFEIIRRKIICPEFVATFDSDGQMDITDLPKMVEILEKNPKIDVILWSRFLEKIPENMPIMRKIILKIGIFFTKIISWISLSDTHNGYRVFRENILAKIRISLDGMGHASEILDIISREKISFQEFGVKISYTDYSLHKGQKSGNSIKIAIKMILRKFF